MHFMSLSCVFFFLLEICSRYLKCQQELSVPYVEKFMVLNPRNQDAGNNSCRELMNNLLSTKMCNVLLLSLQTKDNVQLSC